MHTVGVCLYGLAEGLHNVFEKGTVRNRHHRLWSRIHKWFEEFSLAGHVDGGFHSDISS